MGPKNGQERSRGGNHGVNKRYAYEKWKYNGDFQQLPTFNQRVESEVMAKSRLAGIINLKYIPTKDNLADIFTKPLKRDVFENMRNRIMDIKTKTKKD